MKKLNKKGKFAAALIIGGLLFGAGSLGNKEKEHAAAPAAAAAENKAAYYYEDEYKIELFRVELINSKNEIFAATIQENDGGGGLYLDNNRNNFKYGDIIKAVFDAADGELIAAEKANDIYITLEDGGRVNAFKWFGGRDSDKQ